MTKENNIGAVEFTIPEKIKIHQDPKSSAQTMWMPFEFPDGSKGAIMVTKVDAKKWTPAKDMKTITIVFNND